jgi:hypothetical protein
MIRMNIRFFSLVVAACLMGCASSPNLVFVEDGGIKAQGQISGRSEKIDLIDIDLKKCPEGRLQDLWVGLSPTNRLAFSQMTEETIRAAGISSTNYYSAPAVGATYFLSGYSFRFEGGRLVRVLASRYGFPPARTAAYVTIGSQKSGHSFSLPCSLEDYEAVFGKRGMTTRGFAW